MKRILSSAFCFGCLLCSNDFYIQSNSKMEEKTNIHKNMKKWKYALDNVPSNINDAYIFTVIFFF